MMYTKKPLRPLEDEVLRSATGGRIRKSTPSEHLRAAGGLATIVYTAKQAADSFHAHANNTTPVLYDLVSRLYEGVDKVVDKVVQIPDPIMAGIYGALGTHLVIKTGQWVSKNIIAPVAPGFEEKALPIAEAVSIAAVAIAFKWADFDIIELARSNPVYLSGMTASILSVFGTLAADLIDRERTGRSPFRRAA